MNIPEKFMVWHSMPTLGHIGTWATIRYPEEAVEAVRGDVHEAKVAEARAEGRNEGLREAAGIAFEADDCYLARNSILALIDAPASAPEPMHENAPRAIIGEIGNQIHNLGCEHQGNEALSGALSDLASRTWEAAKLAPAYPPAPAQPSVQEKVM